MPLPTAGDDFLAMVKRARAEEQVAAIGAVDSDLDPDRLTDAELDEALAAGHAPRSGGPYADLVGTSDIAERLHVPRTVVGKWADQKPRTNGFPAPVHKVHAGRLWRWSEVETWWKGYTPQRGRDKPGRLS